MISELRKVIREHLLLELTKNYNSEALGRQVANFIRTKYSGRFEEISNPDFHDMLVQVTKELIKSKMSDPNMDSRQKEGIQEMEPKIRNIAAKELARDREGSGVTKRRGMAKQSPPQKSEKRWLNRIFNK